MILIDMEMPPTCAKCLLSIVDYPNNIYVGELRCMIRGCKCDRENKSTRPSWCPLFYTNRDVMKGGNE